MGKKSRYNKVECMLGASDALVFSSQVVEENQRAKLRVSFIRVQRDKKPQGYKASRKYRS